MSRRAEHKIGRGNVRRPIGAAKINPQENLFAIKTHPISN
jgi:hypothetical protein